MFNLILEYEPKAIRLVDAIQQQIHGHKETLFVYCTPQQREQLELIKEAPNLVLVSPKLSGDKNNIKQYLLSLSKSQPKTTHTVLLKPSDNVSDGFVESIRKALKPDMEAVDIFTSGYKKDTRIVNTKSESITYHHGYLTGYKTKVTIKDITLS